MVVPLPPVIVRFCAVHEARELQKRSRHMPFDLPNAQACCARDLGIAHLVQPMREKHVARGAR